MIIPSAKHLRSVLSALVAALSVCLYSQPSMIHLSLGASDNRQKAVQVSATWCSGLTSEDQYVVYGLKPDPAKKIRATVSDFHGKAVMDADLKNLRPGRKYYYKCGSDESGWSKVYSFSSEPRSGSFRVAVIGDTQDNLNNENFTKTSGIVKSVLEFDPMFTLHMGDIVNDGSKTDSWEGILAVSQDLIARSPLMPVLGNHDINNEKGENFQKPYDDFHRLFSLPGDEVNYSFTYGNVRFIGVFSGYAQGAEPEGLVRYKPGSPEYGWLEDELSKAENDKSINWIIVWMHYPVNSFGWSNIKGWKDNILPILEKHRVDLCLAGHRHVYERHLQMKDGTIAKKSSANILTAGDGTLFITNGTAGGNPTGPGGKEIPTIAFTPDNSMYCFAIMDVTPSSIKYQVFSADKTIVDSFTLVK
jgi:3',5'-cyclic AMP phosphodiesterase CpdA